METAKPEANAYRIASAALERTETAYDRLLWRQVEEKRARAVFLGPVSHVNLSCLSLTGSGTADLLVVSRG